MRNLKRALSLALAVIMVLGLMIVGAGAVSYNDLTDKDEIVNKDAVSLLVTLGVIEGKPDGSYAPDENVDRAQMAKMISVILNKGVDNNALYTDVTSGLTDVDTCWAKGHINFCYTRKIIAGRGDGTFDPNATVTGAEAAKMLLVAAGYDPAIEGFEGADWAMNVNAKASALGIFDGYTKSIMDPLNRDDAALLIYNALDIEMIQKYENGYAIAYDDNRTILSTMYGVYKVEGVVVGNEWAYLENTDSDYAMAEGKTRLAEVVLIDSDTLSTTTGVEGTAQPDTTFNVSTSVDLIGQTVTMYIRKTTILSNSEVLGVYVKEDANVVMTTADAQGTMKDYLKGTGLSTDADTAYYVNYGVQASEGAATAAMSFEQATGRFTSVNGNTNAYGVEMTVIDNDDDGIVDYVLYMQETLSQVTARNTSKETTTLNGFNDNKTIDDADIVTDIDLSEGALVLAVTYGGRYYVSEPQVVAGEMDSFQASKTKEQTITVGGEAYHPSYIQYKAETADNTYEFNILNCDTENGVQFGITYDFILDSNGNVIAYRPSEAGLYNYALVLDSGYEPGAFASDASGKVKVLLPDGTEGTYTLNFSASAKNVGKQIAEADGVAGTVYSTNQGIQELKGFLGTADSDNSATAPWTTAVTNGTQVFADAAKADTDYLDGQAKGYVIGYSLNDDNVLTITSIVGANTDDTTAAVADYNDTTVDSILSEAYSTGAARIRYNSTSMTIDKNTIAFYYEVKDGKTTYGVAVGYDKMSDVARRTPFVAASVRNTNLAGVVLFNAEGTMAEKDYVYVLSKNTVTSSTAILNVVNMDGTIGEMTISRSNYDSVFTSDSKFGTAYAYKASGDQYEIDDEDLTVVSGYALKLSNGSLALYSDEELTRYVDSYSYSEQIWNVENAAAGDEKAPAGAFTDNVGKEVVLVLDTKGDKVRAAYIERTLTDVAAPGFAGDVQLGEPYVVGNALWTVNDIETELKKGNNVLIDDNWTANAALTIPKGLGVQVTGDLNMGSYAVTMSDTSKLIAGGTLTTAAAQTLNGSVKANALSMSGALTVNGTVNVVNDIDTNGNALTVNQGKTLNVDGSILENGAIAVNGTLNVRENVDGAITVNNGGKATVSGNVVGAVTLTNGSVSVTGNLTGNVTQTKGSLSVAGNLTATSSNAIKVDTDNSLTVTGTLDNQGGTVTVDNGKTLSVGALGTRSTAAGVVTVTDGTLTVNGVAYTGNVIVTKGSMSTGELTSSGTVALGVNSSSSTKGNLTVNGDLTVGGNVTMNYGDLTVEGDLENDTHTITVGNSSNGGTAGKLIVDGEITGTGTLTVTVGTATVGGVDTVADVAAGQSLQVLGNVDTITDNNGTITVTGDVATITDNNGNTTVNGDVTGNISDISGGSVTVAGKVEGNATLDDGTLTVGGVDGTLTLTATTAATLNLNGAAKIAAALTNDSNTTIKLGKDANLTLDSTSAAIDISGLAGFTYETGAKLTINYVASNNITLPAGVSLLNGATPVGATISSNANNGTYTYNGTDFVK